MNGLVDRGLVTSPGTLRRDIGKADRSGAGGAFEDAAVRRRLADSLLKKDLIVPERWSEMVAGG